MRSHVGLLIVLALVAASCSDTTARPTTSAAPTVSAGPRVSTTEPRIQTTSSVGTTTTTFPPGLPSGQRGCGSLESFYYATDLVAMEAQPVILATILGDTGLLGELLATGSDPDEINEFYGQTGLTTAIESDCYEAIDLLLTAGASPNLSIPEMMWTPLQMAIRRDNAALVERLIVLGADVDAVGPEEDTALTLAASREAPSEVLRLLLDAGADLEHSNWVGTAIENAVGSVDNVTLLFEAGAEPAGALYEAVAVNALGTLKYLLDQGIPVNVPPPADARFPEQSLLARAEATGRTEIAQFLRDLGAE
ncbi:hypothetical protein MNBD_ACTINO02-2631 [hydrothermal vent metagenome]|uniref:Uncharacterized protein n=1 Tax=hydrothermal vent metagenome TaxID=652676 RepID=A0A3B0SW81_9ZZZZ